VWLHLRPQQQSIPLVIEAVRRFSPAPVVALADIPADEQALELMERGAVGYCHSHASAPLLKQVATVVTNQGLWVTPTLLGRLIRASLPITTTSEAHHELSLGLLSAREREVAEAVSAGASNKEIARKLRITERTVKAHMSAIFNKLGVRDRLHLALLVRGADR
jgi:DNA-binding NarL/FixJ family response regulator